MTRGRNLSLAALLAGLLLAVPPLWAIPASRGGATGAGAGRVPLYSAYDHLGSVLAVADLSGNVIRRSDYLTYGDLRAGSPPGGLLPFGHHGALFDPASGLYNHRARWRHPALMRWMSRDPSGLINDPNTYQFAGGTPTTWVDRDGQVVRRHDNTSVHPGVAALAEDPSIIGLTVGGAGLALGSEALIAYYVLRQAYRGTESIREGGLAAVPQVLLGVAGGVASAYLPSMRLLVGTHGVYQAASEFDPSDPLSTLDLLGAGALVYSSFRPGRCDITGGGGGSGGGRTPGAPGTELRPVGSFLESVHDIVRNPELLTGQCPQSVWARIGIPHGWRMEGLGQGTHRGQGWVLREYLPNGSPSGRLIRWHPGGGRHGPHPYWRVSSPSGGRSRLIRAWEDVR